MYSDRKVHLVGVLSVFLENDCVRSNQFKEVVHDKPGKDFLVNVLHLFCVEMEQTKGVFEFSEGRFNTPSAKIKRFEVFGGELITIQVGNHGFG